MSSTVGKNCFNRAVHCATATTNQKNVEAIQAMQLMYFNNALRADATMHSWDNPSLSQFGVFICSLRCTTTKSEWLTDAFYYRGLTLCPSRCNFSDSIINEDTKNKKQKKNLTVLTGNKKNGWKPTMST